MMQNNKKIAITGRIGSGKSSVAKFIAEQGFTVVSCDEIYKELLQDKSFIEMLEKEFGDISTDDGNLDKKKLSAIVFNDKLKLNKLNSITHPLIISEALKRMEKEEISFCEVPLLFEGGYEKLFDEVIVVLRDKMTCIESAAKRDNTTQENIRLRIDNQFDYDKNNFTKYYVIHNDNNLIDLKEKTSKTIKNILNK